MKSFYESIIYRFKEGLSFGFNKSRKKKNMSVMKGKDMAINHSNSSKENKTINNRTIVRKENNDLNKECSGRIYKKDDVKENIINKEIISNREQMEDSELSNSGNVQTFCKETVTSPWIACEQKCVNNLRREINGKKDKIL